jgi:capsular exopolysaccharide synthesis family protein
MDEDEIDLRKVFSHLKDNAITIFLITLTIGMASGTYAYFLQPIYSSDVSIAFSDQKMSKLSSLLPDELSQFSTKDSELETVKLTLKTRKFINSVIKDLNLSQHYYVEKNYRKNEVYNFSNLRVSLDIKDKDLYGEYFQLKPIDENHFCLSIKALSFSKDYNYGTEIKERAFTLKIRKEGSVENTLYYFKSMDKTLIADEIIKNMKVELLSDNVMKIIYQDTVALRAKEIVNEIAESFMRFTLDKKTSELSQTLEFLDTQIGDAKRHLANEGNKLKNYQQRGSTFIPKESNQVIFEMVTTKKEELQGLLLQLKELKNFKKSLKNNQLNTVSLLNSGIAIGSIQSLVERFRLDNVTLLEMRLQLKNIRKSITLNRQLSLLIQGLNEEDKLLENLRFNFTVGHPQVIQANKEIFKRESEIRSYIKTNIKKLEKSQLLTKKKILSNIVMTEKNINSTLKVLKRDLKEKNSLLHSLPEKELNIQNLKRKFTLSENIYTFLLQKKMEIEISKASIIVNTQIIEDPIEAYVASKPNRKLIIVVGLLVGLIIGIFFTALRAMLDSKIRDASTVSELTDSPLYGQLPFKSNRRFFDEALRYIRTNLQFVIPKEQECTRILISSTIAGEGKTTVVAGLGNIISKTGKRVLLIDLDFRKPRLYREVEKSNKIGVTQYLIEDLDLFSLIQPINKNLDFLPAGAVPPNPSELLMSDKFDKSIMKLMKEYDYIIFDTPPIGAVIDANMVLKYSDIFLLIVQANVADKLFLEKFNELKIEKNIKSTGIILNRVKVEKNNGYGYGYGYGYGTHQEKKDI